MTTISPGLTPNSHTASAEAAVTAKPNAKTLREQLYSFLIGRGERGATDEEMQMSLRMNGSTQRPRRGELFNAGRVADSGTFRMTNSGRRAVVWVAI